MKKLITIILILASSLVFSQKTEFLKVYTVSTFVDSEGKSNGWQNKRTVFIFNYGNDIGRVIMSSGTLEVDFTQIGETVEGKTIGNIGYRAMTLITLSGERYVLMYFDDQENYGVRLVGSSGGVIEFNN